MDYGISAWYKLIKNYTIPTKIVEYPPKASQALAHILSKPEVIIAAEEITPKMLSTVPWLKDILDPVNDAIREFGGKAFVKWDMMYPKDACFYTEPDRVEDIEKVSGKQGNVCLVSSAEAFIWLSMNSPRIYAILDKEPGALYPVAVREPMRLGPEARIFIVKQKPVAAVQYYPEEPIARTDSDAKKILEDLMVYALDALLAHLPYHSATIDIAVTDKGPIIIEVNPPITSGRTDPIWDAVKERWEKALKEGKAIFVYRIDKEPVVLETTI